MSALRRRPIAEPLSRRVDESEFERLRRRLRVAVVAMIAVSVVGVVGFAFINRGDGGIVDALYMTVITLTTVGYGEIVDMTGDPAGRLFTVVLLLMGLGVVTYSLPMLGALVIEGQLNNIFVRKRMERAIARMSGHYIVCGDGPTSWHVADELMRTRRPVVVVVPSDEHLSETSRRGEAIPGVAGDCTDDDTLALAGIERAAGVVFCMANQKDNVLGVLTARRLAPSARIIAATEDEATGPKLRSAGADAAVSPCQIGALRMASELVRPTAVSFLDQMLRVADGSLRVEEVAVPEEVAGSNQTLGSLRIDEVGGALLLAARHPSGEFEFKPRPDQVLDPGLTLIVMADAEGRAQLERRLSRREGR